MSAVEPVSEPVVFFFDKKALNGALGEAFVRPGPAAGGALVPVRRLVYRLTCPGAYFAMLHDYIERKQVFRFEVHRQVQVELSVAAVVSELVKKGKGDAVCLVEFDLP